MTDRDITISVPDELFRDAQALATARQISVSQLLIDELEDLVKCEALREAEYGAARLRSMARLEKGFNLGTYGTWTWTRDELDNRKL